MGCACHEHSANKSAKRSKQGVQMGYYQEFTWFVSSACACSQQHAIVQKIRLDETLQGYNNKDGTAKTECGIHVAGEDEASGLSNIRK